MAILELGRLTQAARELAELADSTTDAATHVLALRASEVAQRRLHRQGAAAEARGRWLAAAASMPGVRVLELFRTEGLEGPPARKLVAATLEGPVSREALDLGLPGLALAYVLDQRTGRLIAPGRGASLDLSERPILKGTLVALVRRCGAIATKHELFEAATGLRYNPEFNERNVHKNVERLRRALVEVLGEEGAIECRDGDYALPAAAVWGLLIDGDETDGAKPVWQRRIVEALRPGPMSASELADAVALSRTALRDRLRVLLRRRIVRRDGRGRATVYRLVKETIAPGWRRPNSVPGVRNPE
jgi:hypothetical protein